MNLFSFQARVRQWLVKCFGPLLTEKKEERNERFAEESVELLQAAGFPLERLISVAKEVYSKPPGEIGQEMAGTATTLAAMAHAYRVDLHEAVTRELDRIEQPEVMNKIRLKNLNKSRPEPLTEEERLQLLGRAVGTLKKLTPQEHNQIFKGTVMESCEGCGFVKNHCRCQHETA